MSPQSSDLSKYEYLNSLLKVVDIICSALLEFNSKKETSKYGAAIILINEEKAIITELCQRFNINK